MSTLRNILLPLGLLGAIATVLVAVAVLNTPSEDLGEQGSPQEIPTISSAPAAFAAFYEIHPKDDETVGFIGDSPITRGDIRRIIAFRRGWEKIDPATPVSKSDEDALYQAIVPELDLRIWNEAARQAGFSATDEEVRAYIERVKEACPTVEDCPHIAHHGLTVEEYFDSQFADVRHHLARTAYLASRDEQSADTITWDTMQLELREQFPINWLDLDVQAIYESALADPQVNFEN